MFCGIGKPNIRLEYSQPQTTPVDVGQSHLNTWGKRRMTCTECVLCGVCMCVYVCVVYVQCTCMCVYVLVVYVCVFVGVYIPVKV